MLDVMACQLSWECMGRIAAFQTFMNVVRYFPIAGAAFLFLWVLGRRRYLGARIQERFPRAEKIWHEIRWSFVTLLVFVGIAVGSVVLGKLGYTQIYLDFDKFGWPYAIASLVGITIFHETYFYWMHRLVHRRGLFKTIHLTHHKSVNPSPFAAYGFNAYEAFLEGVYGVIFVFVVPMHPAVLMAHFGYAMVMNIWWHTGYEFFPSGWTRGPLTRWINTATHHNMHHSHTNGNYSLYFNFWDRVMGTNFPNYDEYYESVVARRHAARAERLSGSEPAAPRAA